MSRLKIIDLSFFEAELSNSGEVQGGQPVGSVSASVTAAVNIGSYVSWGVYKSPYNRYTVAANVYGYGGGAAAGAAAAAASDGTQYTSSYAQASVY